MEVVAGTRLGPYEIISRLGAGGIVHRDLKPGKSGGR